MGARKREASGTCSFAKPKLAGFEHAELGFFAI
jgi:hypothetical protein